MRLDKKGIYKEIQKYIYANNFSDLKVFSKQYFHSIVLPIYSDNSKCEPYSIISIDFNNMQQINKNGMERGDEILHDSIAIMQSVMPNGSLCIRTGGDEFLFILPGVSKEDALIYESKLHEELQNFSEKIDNATVTSHCLDNRDSHSLASLLDIADSAINLIKLTSKSNYHVNDLDLLQNKIRENFTTFFNTLRLHKFPMTPVHMRNILTSAINSYDLLVEDTELEDDFVPPMPGIKTINSIETLKKLNNFFINNRYVDINDVVLDEFDATTFASVLDALIRDPLTQQFNKAYLMQYLLEDNNYSFKVLRFSSAFVKICNTVNHSHTTTDKQIRALMNSTYNFLVEHVNFNQDSFSDMPSNYMISLDGGDMLLLLDGNTDLSIECIQDFLGTQIPSEYSKDNIIRIVCANNFRNINKKNVINTLMEQSDECNQNKIPFIDKLLNDDIIDTLLTIALRDTMTFYRNIVPDVNNISAKINYINLVSQTVLDLYSSLDVVPSDKTAESVNQKCSSTFEEKTTLSSDCIEASSKEKQTRETNISFVPKVDIDYSKIRYSKDENFDGMNNRDSR